MIVNPEGELMLRRLIDLRVAVAKFVDAIENAGVIQRVAALKNLTEKDREMRELEEDEPWAH